MSDLRLKVKISLRALADAPVCANCHDYIEDPHCRLVQRARGWVHAGNNSVRCAGQEDDDTDDRAEPLVPYQEPIFRAEGWDPERYLQPAGS